MRHSASLLAALCISLVVAHDVVGAEPRAAQPKAARIGPRFGFVTPTTDAAQLAALLVGPGVAIANARYTGDAQAAGTFGDAQADVGVAGGVVLSTGRVVDTKGPNQSSGLSEDFELPGDGELDALVAPYRSHDAAVLEFDVTPAAGTISVRFVFASEEYSEYVGTQFNDAIAILVNGVNCANHHGLPVSVNVINRDSTSALFLDNELGTRGTAMDGLTTPFECVAAVTPGAPNRVKIAIGDTADGILDSAVFLAEGGVRSPGVGPLTTSVLVKAIEYYHAAFDHFFVTTIPDEVAKLDNGTFVGWARTGHAFNVFLSGTPDTADVCRFFSTSFTPKSSHFYTPFTAECASVKQNANWQFEAAVFNTLLPNPDGSCPSGMQPLYRVYNDGMGAAPNHRYSTDAGVFGVMQALGWKPEGAGAGVIACVPR